MAEDNGVVAELVANCTVAELLDAAFERIVNIQGDDRSPASREWSLAKTAIEDARMRFTRGMAMREGVFAPVDLEKVSSLEERKAWVDKIEQQLADE